MCHMKKLRIDNGMVFDLREGFVQKPLYILEERIVSKTAYEHSDLPEHVMDARETYVIPGLTDIHFHGCIGADCCDGSPEAFRTMAEYELRHGITQITPATMTVSETQLAGICDTARDFSCPGGADFCGLYMEGPFINRAKKGAQNDAFIRTADTGMLERLQERSGGKIRTVIVAPETEGAMDFIRENHIHINISLGHTAADYEITKEALENGASQLTHMFNAMPPLSHRDPGPIAAAAEHDSCMAELICDGVHIHPSVIRAAFRLFGDDRIILISDTMRAAGLSDGSYDLGGQNVLVNGNLATLKDRTIAGSVTNLMDCMRNAVLAMQIPLKSAVRCAAFNPARAIGIDKDYGTLDEGKTANIVLLKKEDLAITDIIHRGQILHQGDAEQTFSS